MCMGWFWGHFILSECVEIILWCMYHSEADFGLGDCIKMSTIYVISDGPP